MDLSSVFVSLLVAAILIAVITFVARRSTTDKEVDWFRYQYDARVVAAGADLITAYLRRTRRWRVAGVLIGIASMAAIRTTTGSRVDLLECLFVGWFAAGLLAESTSGRRSLGARRVASLERRTIGAILPPFAHRMIVAATVCSLAAAAWTLLLLTVGGPRHPTAPPARWWHLFAGLAWTASVTAIAWLGMRHLVLKPAPSHEDPEIAVADAAIRTASVVRVAAGWAALLFIGTIKLGWTAGLATRAPWSWAPWSLVMTGLAGVVVAWAGVPTRVVRRRRAATV